MSITTRYIVDIMILADQLSSEKVCCKTKVQLSSEKVCCKTKVDQSKSRT